MGNPFDVFKKLRQVADRHIRTPDDVRARDQACADADEILSERLSELQLLGKALVYKAADNLLHPVYLKRRGDKWVVSMDGDVVLDKTTMEFVHDGMPSGRTDDFKERCYFDDLFHAHGAAWQLQQESISAAQLQVTRALDKLGVKNAHLVNGGACKDRAEVFMPLDDVLYEGEPMSVLFLGGDLTDEIKVVIDPRRSRLRIKVIENWDESDVARREASIQREALFEAAIRLRREVIGEEAAAARKKVEAAGLEWRVSDGVIPYDTLRNRLNVRVRDGLVSEAWIG